MSTDPTRAEEISLPLRMYFTAQDAPHWSKGGDEHSRTVHRSHRSHRFAEMVKKLKRLVHAANEARSLDASGMSLEGAKHLEISADAAHTAIRLFIQDVERAAERYRQAELDAHTAAPEGFPRLFEECNSPGPEGERCIRKTEHKGEHMDGFHSGAARWPQTPAPPASPESTAGAAFGDEVAAAVRRQEEAHPFKAVIDHFISNMGAEEPAPFKPTASPADVAARAIADLKAQKAQREAPVATVTELRHTSETPR